MGIKGGNSGDGGRPLVLCRLWMGPLNDAARTLVFDTRKKGMRVRGKHKRRCLYGLVEVFMRFIVTFLLLLNWFIASLTLILKIAQYSVLGWAKLLFPGY